MSKALITEQTLTDIANNMRSNGASGNMTPAEMSTKVKDFFPLDVFFAKEPFAEPKDKIVINCPMREQAPTINNNNKMRGTKIANHIYIKFYGKTGSSVEYINFLSEANVNKITIDVSESDGLSTTSQFENFASYSSVEEVEVIKLASQEVIIPQRFFYDCQKLRKISGFNSKINQNAFYSSNITDDIIKTLTVTKSEIIAAKYAFGNCKNLVNVDCTNLTNGQKYTYTFDSSFMNSSNLTSAYFPMPENLNLNSTLKLTGSCFYRTNLTALIIGITSIPAILGSNTNAVFKETPIESGTGYVYVPDELVDSYKTATNWVTIADNIKPISDLPQEYKTIYGL